MTPAPNRGLKPHLASAGLLMALHLAAAGPAAAAEPDPGDPAVPAAELASAEPAGEPRGRFEVVPFALPAYAPESSLMVVGAAVLAYQPPRESGLKESSLMLAGAASLRRQFSLLLQPEWYFLGDALQLSGLAGVERFPDTFFGVGPDARKQDAESYTPDFLEAVLNPSWRVAPSLYLGPLFRVQSARMGERAPGGALARGSIPGSEGGTTVQLGATATWDTRDNTLNPHSGILARLTLQSAHEAIGSSFGFTVGKLDARGYVALPWGGHVLAAQALVELRAGEPPFYDLGRLGGPATMRGYYSGQYRDRQLAAAQLEYRAPLFWRIGAVAFASVGNVARDVSGLVDSLKPAGGLGVRWAPLAAVPINIRLDVAYGNDFCFYLRMGEAF